MTDSTKAIVWDAVYTPFGQVHSITGTATNNQRFPGQYADAETGYSYNYFRDYDPTTGRYVQSDPIGLAGGFNTYAYVYSNPLAYSDPTGEITSCFKINAKCQACRDKVAACKEKHSDPVACLERFDRQQNGGSDPDGITENSPPGASVGGHQVSQCLSIMNTEGCFDCLIGSKINCFRELLKLRNMKPPILR